MAEIISDRQEVDQRYSTLLKTVDGRITRQLIRPGTTYNYAYFPIVFNSEEELLRVQENMNEANIFPRRYFYPCLSTLNYVEGGENAPLSSDLSKRILCLPFHSELQADLQGNIIDLLIEAL
jgi:dTDP-4-amino-4,6-dideoxygalactose transaminase